MVIGFFKLAFQLDENQKLYTVNNAKKNACWIWIAIDRLGHRFLHVVIGSRATETGQCLWEGIAHHKMANVMSDYWQPDQVFLPPEIHIQSKAQTLRIASSCLSI